MQSKRIFLLGGYDLEMKEIKHILETKGEKYIDKHLSWGAKLSNYKENLNFDGTIYGIELDEDITPPKNYSAIDHHGEYDNKTSSLEQVAKTLDIELTRKQKLIAANDSRYINGMKNLCATQKEIEKIRRLDREAQGISKEDEELAKKSVEASDTNIIYSKTNHFSATSDIAYSKYHNYIVYSDTKVVFYGYKQEDILKFLHTQSIQNESYYYGGGKFGFVGIKENVLAKEQIDRLIQEFEKMQKNQEQIYSYHTFMLPFTFKEEFKKGDRWKYKPYKVDTQKAYNEYVYFYKHIQDALFNKNDESKNDIISKYYELELGEKGTYTINCKKGDFTLELDGISLRIFNTDVAILSFNLKNTRYEDLDSVLAINDFGRRIYPQFLGEKYTQDTKEVCLANCITLQFNDGTTYYENFSKYDKSENLDSIKILPEFITKLLEDHFKEETSTDQTRIKPIIDDRMFVISQYHNDELVNKLKIYKNIEDMYEYETNEQWYRYVFVDGDSKTCQSKHLCKKLIQQSTYDRWVDWGTLFGISRYSFVAITGNWFGKNILLPHMQTMYFQMFTLLLAYRATIIKFADDIQETTKLKKKELAEETRKLYNKYLKFLNKLYFREITAQDQGIELYNQAIEVMDIEKYMKDLDSEINELNSYVEFVREQERNKSLDFISKMGAVLLPPSLLVGFYGMNILAFNKTVLNEIIALIFIMISVLLGRVYISKIQSIIKHVLLIIFTIAFLITTVLSQLKSIPTNTKNNTVVSKLNQKENHE